MDAQGFDKVLDLVHAERPDVVLFLEVTPEWALALREPDEDYPYHRVVPDGRGARLAGGGRIPIH